VLNPRWDGVNQSTTPGTSSDTTHKYLIGGYFNVASAYPSRSRPQYRRRRCDRRLSHSTPERRTSLFPPEQFRDMVLQNLAKYYGRYRRSAYAQTFDVSDQQGVMVGGAKIIWADSRPMAA